MEKTTIAMKFYFKSGRVQCINVSQTYAEFIAENTNESIVGKIKFPDTNGCQHHIYLRELEGFIVGE